MRGTSAGGEPAPKAATPMGRYREDLKREGFEYDAAQEAAVAHLQRLYDALLSTPTTVPKTVLANKGLKARMAGLMGKKSAPAEPVTPSVQGLYFWGGWAVARLTWSTPSMSHCRLPTRCVPTFIVSCSGFITN